MSKIIKVLLVEDNPDYRDVIAIALEGPDDIELSQEFGTAEIALRRVEQARPSQHPDLAILDLNLPGMSGLDAIPYFKQAAPQTKILILTQSDAERDVLRAISLGADGYLLKSASLDEITSAIRDTVQGGSPLDKNVARFILNQLKKHIPSETIENILTNREMQILQQLSEGFLKKQIAAQLNISYTTVDTHVGHIYEKLGVKNAPAAVNKGHQLGLFQLDN
jgi:DNA-binding NarL/FixJ family response regulator